MAVMAMQPAYAAAQTAPASDPMQITLKRAKIVVENGKEIAQSAAVARPGDTLEESVSYKNVSKGPLTKVEATLPVPPNTELMMSSVKPANAKASLDGKTFSDIPLKRKVRQPNGVEVEQLVPLSEYRFLRWYPGDLKAGESLSFSARFKIANSADPAISSVAAKPN
jgi:hypothetical protein